MNSPRPTRRAPSMPLDPARALAAATELAREIRREAEAAQHDFDKVMGRLEVAVMRFRAACLAQNHPEAQAAVAYHDREAAKLAAERLSEGFVPLYQRRAVLDNVLGRYTRCTTQLLGATA